MTTLLRAAVATVRAVGRLIASIHRATVVRYINAGRRSRGRAEMNRGQRQFTAVAASAVAALVGAAISTGGTTAVPRSITAATPVATAAPAATATGAVSGVTDRGVADAPADTVGDTAAVARVVDGDTFTLTNGGTVRVLGIDSCESDTPGGRDATAAAERFLGSSQVTLAAEPGVDRDRYGRLLRYVVVGEHDFGEQMVRFDHTGVYGGANDASAAYLATLYASDLMYAAAPPTGRVCGEDPPPAATYDVPSHSDDSSYAGRKAKGYVCRKTIFC